MGLFWSDENEKALGSKIRKNPKKVSFREGRGTYRSSSTPPGCLSLVLLALTVLATIIGIVIGVVL